MVIVILEISLQRYNLKFIIFFIYKCVISLRVVQKNMYATTAPPLLNRIIWTIVGLRVNNRQKCA